MPDILGKDSEFTINLLTFVTLNIILLTLLSPMNGGNDRSVTI